MATLLLPRNVDLLNLCTEILNVNRWMHILRTPIEIQAIFQVNFWNGMRWNICVMASNIENFDMDKMKMLMKIYAEFMQLNFI